MPFPQPKQGVPRVDVADEVDVMLMDSQVGDIDLREESGGTYSVIPKPSSDTRGDGGGGGGGTRGLARGGFTGRAAPDGGSATTAKASRKPAKRPSKGGAGKKARGRKSKRRTR